MTITESGRPPISPAPTTAPGVDNPDSSHRPPSESSSASAPRARLRSRFLAWLHRNAKGLVLLLCTALSVLLAVASFPWDDQVAARSDIHSVRFYTDLPVSLVTVGMSPHNGGTRMTFTANITQLRTAIGQQQIQVGILVPSTTWGTKPQACAKNAYCSVSIEGKEADLALNIDGKSHGSLTYANAYIDVPAVHGEGYGVATNAENAEVSLPMIRFLSFAGTQLAEPSLPLADESYVMPSNTDYDWITGSNPLRTSWGLEWSASLPTDSILESGVAKSRASLDDHKTFVAGALIGLAGAFLAAAFDEFRLRPTKKHHHKRSRKES